MRARFYAGHEQHVDAGFLIGFEPRDGVFDAGHRHGAGAADKHQPFVLPPGKRRLHLADALCDRDQRRARRAVAGRQRRVLDGHAGDARGLEFFHGAFDVERVAVAVIGVDQERQLAGAVDAVGLLREFGQREHDDVGRAEHRERRDRAGEHAGLEAEILGDARRDRVEHRARINATRSRDDGAQPLPSVSPIHPVSPDIRSLAIRRAVLTCPEAARVYLAG